MKNSLSMPAISSSPSLPHGRGSVSVCKRVNAFLSRAREQAVRSRRPRRLLGVLIPAMLLSTACMVGPKYQRPAAPPSTAYKEPLPEGWKEAQPSDGAIRGKWWEIYNDPNLNALEEQVNISNQNVLSAEAQYREARDAVRIARSGLFPTVSGNVGIVNSKSSGTLVNNNGGAAFSPAPAPTTACP